MLLLIIVILISAYFLSQVGFLNCITGGDIHSLNIDVDRMTTSNDSQIKTSLYSFTFQSKMYLAHLGCQVIKFRQRKYSQILYLRFHVLFSYGLIPDKLALPITNTMLPPQGSFIYLGTLNVANGNHIHHSYWII